MKRSRFRRRVNRTGNWGRGDQMGEDSGLWKSKACNSDAWSNFLWFSHHWWDPSGSLDSQPWSLYQIWLKERKCLRHCWRLVDSPYPPKTMCICWDPGSVVPGFGGLPICQVEDSTTIKFPYEGRDGLPTPLTLKWLNLSHSRGKYGSKDITPESDR